MLPTRQGSFRLFRLWGITVHLHLTWFLMAMYSISARVPNYTTPLWGLLEYLALFLIVLMHEFGHSLACRQVGGHADQIVLWPLGGVAYVAPPARPGATLWSIAAGPLVNVLLLPAIYGAYVLIRASGGFDQNADLHRFVQALVIMDLGLLVFNLLPVYPLDGGQILRSLLWFPFGAARSLIYTTAIGFVGGAGFIVLAISEQDWWIGILAFFLLSNCWRSYQHALGLRKVEQLPRRPEFKCPDCSAHPPIGSYWLCPACRQAFDPFASGARCPQCSTVLDLTTCPDCHGARAHRTWDVSIRDV